MTRRADKPLPPAGIAEPERAAPDVPWREDHVAARTVRFFPAPRGLPDCPLFVCRVLPRVGQPFATLQQGADIVRDRNGLARRVIVVHLHSTPFGDRTSVPRVG